MKCRHCTSPLPIPFLDLGFAPPSNAYLRPEALCAPELHYPLRLSVCERCWLVQTEDYASANSLFDSEYAYFSSTSSSWVAHAARYCAQVTTRLGLTASSRVVEVASNDGYLLRHFQAAGIPCLGIEPTASTAAAAEALGIPVRRVFFGESVARQLVAEGWQADLLIGNNVFAHVPNLNDFTRGLATLLAPSGTITLEFPHLQRLLNEGQFDTVYHEHFSYLSLSVVSRIFNASGLKIWDVDELPTHGGSLRIYGCHQSDPRAASSRVAAVLSEEHSAGLETKETYAGLQVRANRIKNDLLAFLLDEHAEGRHVAAYGAAAKGNTLLNFAGIRPDLVAFVCDAAAAKQGKFLPGSHIPILPPETLKTRTPDTVLILPWNLASEISEEIKSLVSSSVKMVTAIPELRVL